MWMEQIQNNVVFPAFAQLTGKSLTVNQWCWWKVHSEGETFGHHNPPGVKNPK